MEPMEPTPETVGKTVAEEPAGEDEDRRRPICPWCDSGDVEKVSEYGPHLMVYSYICLGCNSPFEVIKR